MNIVSILTLAAVTVSPAFAHSNDVSVRNESVSIEKWGAAKQRCLNYLDQLPDYVIARGPIADEDKAQVKKLTNDIRSALLAGEKRAKKARQEALVGIAEQRASGTLSQEDAVSEKEKLSSLFKLQMFYSYDGFCQKLAEVAFLDDLKIRSSFNPRFSDDQYHLLLASYSIDTRNYGAADNLSNPIHIE